MQFDLVGTLLISLALTLALELLFCFFAKIRGLHNYILIVLVNILTNPPVVLTHNLLRRYTGISPIVIVVVLEALVIFGEAVCYKYCSKDIKRPLLLSLCANAFSYLTGLLLIHLI
ncbi:MAG: hypothetical protein RSC86_07670 [Oscillospiraceae bacterium]